MSPFRVAVVGLGLIGKQRAAALQELDDVELAATVDPTMESTGGIPHFASVEDLLDGPPFDAAVVAVPHDLTADIASQLLTRGVPVLIEKPLGRSVEEATMLMRLAEKCERPSFVGYNYRFLPSVRGILDAIADGTIGRLRSCDFLIGHGGHPGSAEGWKLDPVRAGGGVILDPGVHLLDLLLELLPGAKTSSVLATGGFWGTGVEEDVAMTFAGGGALATVRASHVRWINTFRLEVFGDEGYAIAEGRGGNYGPITLRVGKRWQWAKGGLPQRETECSYDFGDHDRSLADELAAIIEIWRTGASTIVPSPATFADGLRVAELSSDLYSRLTFSS
jgi:1,5-anhydro-D-fructose reductase (1,5-anhydro-D-mannitol-forming)